MATEVNISSYSGSVVAGDWGPAITAAVTDLPNGGTINIDADLELKSQINIIPSGNYFSLLFRGNSGNSIMANAGSDKYIFNFGNLNQVKFENIPFVGKQIHGGTVDCARLIHFSYLDNGIIENCLFAGVMAAESIVAVGAAADGSIRNCKFGGCGATGATSGIVWLNAGNGLSIKGCQFIDYQNYLTSYYDRDGAFAWIAAVNPPPSNAATASYLDIADCRFDEGAERHIAVTDYIRVRIARTTGNHNGTSLGYAITLDGVLDAKITQAWTGFHAFDRPFLVLTNCGYVLVDNQQVHDGPHPIVIDAGTTFTEIMNSPGATVASAVGAKYSLNGVKYIGSVAQIG